MELKHVTSEKVEIYWTKDYSRFSFIKGNRDISEKKMKKIEESIKAGLDLTAHCPIIVSPSMKIIDGQHRFMVCKQLGASIYYVVTDDTAIRKIAELNSNTDKWKLNDFINCYIDLGLTDYSKLREVKKEYGFSYGITAALLVGMNVGDGGSHVTEDIQDGKFKITHLDETIEFCEEYIKLKPYTEKIQSRQLIAAIRKLYLNPEFSQEKLIKKIKLSDSMIEPQINIKQTIINIETIYNFKSRERVILY